MGYVRFTTGQGRSYELGYSTPQEQDVVKRRFYEIAKKEGGVRSSYWGSGQSLQPASTSALQRQDPTAIAQSERYAKLSGQIASAEFRDKPSQLLTQTQRSKDWYDIESETRGKILDTMRGKGVKMPKQETYTISGTQVSRSEYLRSKDLAQRRKFEQEKIKRPYKVYSQVPQPPKERKKFIKKVRRDVKINKIKQQVKKQHNIVDRFLKEKVSYPISERLSSKGLTSEKFSEFATMFPVAGTKIGVGGFGIEPLGSGSDWLDRQQREDIQGLLYNWKEEPTKAVVTTAVFFALPKFLKPVGEVWGGVKATKTFSKIVKKFPITSKTTSKISKLFVKSIPVAYGGSVGYRVYKEPKDKRAFKFGGILAGEVIPMAVGGYAGSKFWQKYAGFKATIGRTKLSEESLISESVLSGKERFWTEPKSKHLKLFKKADRFYHATGSSMVGETAKSLKVDPTSSLKTYEGLGLFVSPKVSPNFLRIGASKTSLYGGELLGSYPESKVYSILSEGILVKQNPAIKTLKGFKFKYKSKPGQLNIPGYKTEVEGIFTKDSEFFDVNKAFYFKHKGVRVPLDEFAFISGKQPVVDLSLTTKVKIPKPKKFKVSEIKSILQSSRLPEFYVTTPSSLSLSSLRGISSSKSSRSIMKSFYSSPSVPSSRSSLSSSWGSSSTSGSSSSTPRIPKKAIIIPPPIIWDFKAKKKKSKKQLKKKIKESLYYTPDFTAKALGLSMKVPKSIMPKLPSMSFTGLEIRPIVRIMKKKKLKRKLKKRKS